MLVQLQKEGRGWSGVEESPDARQRGCSATAGSNLAANDASQRPSQHTVDVHEVADQSNWMYGIASARLDTRVKAAQLTGGWACLPAAMKAHCQQLTVQQDACLVAGTRLVLAIEAGSRKGRSGGDLCAAAATMQRATIMRSTKFVRKRNNENVVGGST